MAREIDYKALPAEKPEGWMNSSWVFATHYLSYYLFNPRPGYDRQFADLWFQYQTVRANQPGGALSTKTARAKELDPRFAALSQFEAAIKSSWCSSRGLVEVSSPQTRNGANRNSLDEVLCSVGLGHTLSELDPAGFLGAKPYSRLEKSLHLTVPSLDVAPWIFLDIENDTFVLAWLLARTPTQSKRPQAYPLQQHRVLSRYTRVRLWSAMEHLRNDANLNSFNV
jgi:hypothetical protein